MECPLDRVPVLGPRAECAQIILLLFRRPSPYKLKRHNAPGKRAAGRADCGLYFVAVSQRWLYAHSKASRSVLNLPK